MHIETFNGVKLHEGLGITEDRKDRLHLFAIRCHNTGGPISEQIARLAEYCETPAELAYAVFHYCFLRDHENGAKEERRAERPEMPSIIREMLESIFGDNDEDSDTRKRNDDMRRERWLAGKMSCTCPKCTAIREEMENLHPHLARKRKHNCRPDLN